MKTRILLFLMCLVSLSVMGQSDNTQGTITRKKCATCGKPLSQCKGHNKSEPKTKIQPEKTCGSCGKVLSKCQYKGNHPAPEAAGYDVTFSCNVSSASLFIDGNANGTASGTRFLKTGSHSIKVTASGYEDYTRSITVNRQNTSYNITLNKKPEPVKPVVTTTGTSSSGSPCRRCNGTGICQTCGGCGMVYDDDGSTSVISIHNCNVCNGGGRCSVCDGKGHN